MRVQFALTLAGSMLLATVPVGAQNVAAATSVNQVASAPQPAPPAKSKKSEKAVGDKVCKRLSQGKVCMTPEQWKTYEQQF